jgi:hypothetical protein
VPALNDSEIGLYYIKYNSRLPYVSGIVRTGGAGTTPTVFIEYPENIDLYGISINTTILGGWSLGAEYSFRKDLPIQWNAFELLLAGNESGVSLLEQRTRERLGLSSSDSIAGLTAPGFDRYDVSQAQFTLIKFFDQVMGASRLSLINEVGATYVHDLLGNDKARYGRSGAFGVGPTTIPQGPLPAAEGCSSQFFNSTGGTANPLNLNTAYCENKGFTTDFSWGYRTRLVWDYLDAFSGVNLFPRLAWSHDVKGYAPQPGGAFNEGNKSVGFGLEAVYQNKLSADISYTNYFGGKPYNDFRDRDFISASVSYSF